MFDLKIVDKIKASFIWKDNKKNALNTGKESQAAQVENGQVIQIHNYYDIREIQALSLNGNDTLTLLKNASGRFALEQAVKQDNFQKAVDDADLNSLESHKPLDKDWFIRWMDVAQSVGQDDIRNILSSILKGELGTTKNTSVRTLEVLRNLSTGDLKLFQKFCDISFGCPIVAGITLVVAEPYGSPGSNALESLGLNYAKLTELQDLGLIKSDLTANHPAVAQIISKNVPYTIGPNSYQLNKRVVSRDNYKIKVINFTRVGLEIRDCLELSSNEDYVKKFNEWVAQSFPEIGKEIESETARVPVEPKSEN